VDGKILDGNIEVNQEEVNERRRRCGVIAPLDGVTPEPKLPRSVIRYQSNHTSSEDKHLNPSRTSCIRLNVMAETFSTLPILPLSQALDPATKPKFLEDLRHALLNVGFLYLSETGLPDQLINDCVRECRDFFVKLPQEEKERIEMKNEKSFLGWSRVS
jgi:hypothetical protein